MITRRDVTEANDRIRGRVRRTPVMAADTGAIPGEVFFKLEYLQHTGTFKARGAFNRVLASAERGELDPGVGIVVASGGNAALANAYAAKLAGVPATVYVPETAPAVKVAKLRKIGAIVRQVGTEYSVAYEAALAHAATTGAVLCHAYDQPEIAAGAGTLALELQEQVPGFDTVVVAVGGGGLMAGVAAALEGVAKVVGVEPVTSATLHAALSAGEPVDVPVSGIASDSLGAKRLGEIAFDVATRTNVHSVLVSDDAIIAARTALWNDYRIVVEHGAAAAYAALLSGAYVPAHGERIVVVLCGANTDPTTL